MKVICLNFSYYKIYIEFLNKENDHYNININIFFIFQKKCNFLGYITGIVKIKKYKLLDSDDFIFTYDLKDIKINKYICCGNDNTYIYKKMKDLLATVGILNNGVMINKYITNSIKEYYKY